MAGEMLKQDLEEGGDWYDVRKEMEDIGKKAGAIIKVEPFDQYQGPKGKVYFGATYVGILWVSDAAKWYFEPEINVKLKSGVKPTKASDIQMISFLKKLKTAVPNFKPFEVVPGQKPSHYTTPPLKKAQQKSLLHLVKSKYTIVIAEKIEISFANKRKAEAFLHQLLDSRTKGVFSDNSWQPIHKIFDDFNTHAVDYAINKSEYYKAKGSENSDTPDGKQWDLTIYGTDKGGWHLKIIASFGPSKVGATDRYDVIYTLSWDGRIRKPTE